MSEKIYCIFAFKKSVELYSRGCFMESFNANYIGETGISAEELARQLIYIGQHNASVQGDADFEISHIKIFVAETIDCARDNLSYRLLNPNSTEFKDLVDPIIQATKEECEKEKQAKILKEQQDEQDRKERFERIELERLKSKYE